ncbi:MAG: hypothetical protein QF632_06645 [Candidatus Woesearchaeota archaeon]|jgi:hypothetical protein|nr:hypothetical protein [Candidatus Woesearchaeota archaeon]
MTHEDSRVTGPRRSPKMRPLPLRQKVGIGLLLAATTAYALFYSNNINDIVDTANPENNPAYVTKSPLETGADVPVVGGSDGDDPDPLNPDDYILKLPQVGQEVLDPNEFVATAPLEDTPELKEAKPDVVVPQVDPPGLNYPTALPKDALTWFEQGNTYEAPSGAKMELPGEFDVNRVLSPYFGGIDLGDNVKLLEARSKAREFVEKEYQTALNVPGISEDEKGLAKHIRDGKNWQIGLLYKDWEGKTADKPLDLEERTDEISKTPDQDVVPDTKSGVKPLELIDDDTKTGDVVTQPETAKLIQHTYHFIERIKLENGSFLEHPNGVTAFVYNDVQFYFPSDQSIISEISELFKNVQTLEQFRAAQKKYRKDLGVTEKVSPTPKGQIPGGKYHQARAIDQLSQIVINDPNGVAHGSIFANSKEFVQSLYDKHAGIKCLDARRETVENEIEQLHTDEHKNLDFSRSTLAVLCDSRMDRSKEIYTGLDRYRIKDESVYRDEMSVRFRTAKGTQEERLAEVLADIKEEWRELHGNAEGNLQMSNATDIYNLKDKMLFRYHRDVEAKAQGYATTMLKERGFVKKFKVTEDKIDDRYEDLKKDENKMWSKASKKANRHPDKYDLGAVNAGHAKNMLAIEFGYESAKAQLKAQQTEK